jgi:hypothetical protein
MFELIPEKVKAATQTPHAHGITTTIAIARMLLSVVKAALDALCRTIAPDAGLAAAEAPYLIDG